jgi:hypothetical protein
VKRVAGVIGAGLLLGGCSLFGGEKDGALEVRGRRWPTS